MDTFEILSEIYEMKDRSMARGITSRDAIAFAEQKVSEKYHISFNSVKKLAEN